MRTGLQQTFDGKRLITPAGVIRPTWLKGHCTNQTSALHARSPAYCGGGMTRVTCVATARHFPSRFTKTSVNWYSPLMSAPL